MTPTAILTALGEAIANDGGLVFLFVLIFITGVREVWVWGREVKAMRAQLTDERIDFMRQLGEMREERDTWRRMSLMQQGQHGPSEESHD